MKAMDCILFASPTLHPFNNQHASSNYGPAAPSIPPPLNNDLLAALTIALTTNVVMSPCKIESVFFMRNEKMI